jgi:hypothetical protein
MSLREGWRHRAVGTIRGSPSSGPVTMRCQLLVLASLVAASGVAAQSAARSAAQSTAPAAARPGALSEGDQVRVDIALPAGHPLSRRESVTGTLRRIDADSVLLVEYGTLVSIPRHGVASLSVLVGQRSRGAMMARGAGLGLVAGAVFGGTLAYLAYDDCEGEFICFSRSDETAMGAVLLGGVGAVAGFIGGAMVNGDQWRRVPLASGARVGVAMTSQGPAVALRF